jgi:amylosucrase
VIWSGDELAQLNDPFWPDEPGHEDDNRWAHRPRLDWDRAADRSRHETLAGKVFQGIAHLARARARLPQLHACAATEVLRDTDDGVLATVRRHASGTLVGLYNVCPEPRPFPMHRLHELGLSSPHDALNGYQVTAGADGQVWLPAYAAWWVVDSAGA